MLSTRIAYSIAITLIACAAPAYAADRAVPNFAPSSTTGWIGYGPEYVPVPGSPAPVAADPAHPYIPNAIEYLSARPNLKVVEQSTFPVADLTNPILRPWVRDELRKLNDRVLKGQPVFEHRASCWPAGVPAFLLAVVNPIFFIQTEKQVTMISQGGDHTARRVHLNIAHSPRVTPSWFGESVGHYEGDTLVVDTIGLNTRTFIDNFRTPHTDKLHVTERFTIAPDGQSLTAIVTVEDPETFNGPLTLKNIWRRNNVAIEESICAADDGVDRFNLNLHPIPQQERPDF
jgi:hypothetical protein